MCPLADRRSPTGTPASLTGTLTPCQMATSESVAGERQRETLAERPLQRGRGARDRNGHGVRLPVDGGDLAEAAEGLGRGGGGERLRGEHERERHDQDDRQKLLGGLAVQHGHAFVPLRLAILMHPSEPGVGQSVAGSRSTPIGRRPAGLQLRGGSRHRRRGDSRACAAVAARPDNTCGAWGAAQRRRGRETGASTGAKPVRRWARNGRVDRRETGASMGAKPVCGLTWSARRL